MINSSIPYSDIANRLLLALPKADLERLMSDLHAVELCPGEIIYSLNTEIKKIYFVNRGQISLVKSMEDGRTVEVGAIGIEGITGTNAVFGIQEAIYDTLVQLQGEALCIEYGKLRSHMQLSTALTSLVRGYTHFAISQLAQTAACNRLHSLEQRCANWFIAAQVNARSDTFLITHEFLSMMLGVQRSGISIAARILQNNGLIRYKHGHVTVIDPDGLKAVACECHRTLNSQLDQLFTSK